MPHFFLLSTVRCAQPLHQSFAFPTPLFCATKCENLGIRSTLSKTDTFGTGTKCPSQREFRLIEHQLKEAKKRQGSTLDVRKKESTVNLFRLFSTFSSLISGWTVLNLNLLYGLQSTLSSRTPISLRERPLNIFMLEC